MIDVGGGYSEAKYTEYSNVFGAGYTVLMNILKVIFVCNVAKCKLDLVLFHMINSYLVQSMIISSYYLYSMVCFSGGIPYFKVKSCLRKYLLCTGTVFRG